MKNQKVILPIEREVWDRLDYVMDPELDEPVTDMGFIEDVLIDHNNLVDIVFRLPTYWCSPNFAFLMAEGIKREVEILPWVDRVNVQLKDHLSAEDINSAVNNRRNFSEVFAELTDGDNLEELREKFDVKAFKRRQETVINALLADEYSIASIIQMSLDELENITFTDEEAERQRVRYKSLLLSKGIAKLPTDLALPSYTAKPVTLEGFKKHVDELRAVRINMEFSGALCRGLKQSRYKEMKMIDGEPTLIDFILDRVPKRAAKPIETEKVSSP